MFTVWSCILTALCAHLNNTSVATAALQYMLSIQQLHTSLIEIHQCNDGAQNRSNQISKYLCIPCD